MVLWAAAFVCIAITLWWSLVQLPPARETFRVQGDGRACRDQERLRQSEVQERKKGRPQGLRPGHRKEGVPPGPAPANGKPAFL